MATSGGSCRASGRHPVSRRWSRRGPRRSGRRSRATRGRRGSRGTARCTSTRALRRGHSSSASSRRGSASSSEPPPRRACASPSDPSPIRPCSSLPGPRDALPSPKKATVDAPRSSPRRSTTRVFAKSSQMRRRGASQAPIPTAGPGRIPSARKRPVCRAFFMSEATYTAKDITVLEGLEPVRLRPGMYIGSTGARGLHHLVYEVVDNSVDEALAGRNERVEITLHPDNSVTVRDYGSGIPVDVMPDQGLPALTVVLTKLHAGGKFGGDGYKVSGGLHGVGVSVVNALSEWLVAEVRRDGRIYRQEFARGAPKGEMQIVGETDASGTTISFLP